MADATITGDSTGAGSADSNQSTLGGGTGTGGVSAGAGAGEGSKPQVFDLADDTLIRVKGQGEPVKFGDLSKRQQADYTRKTQQAQQLQATATRERQQLAAERARLEGIAASLASRQDGRGGDADPFLAELGKAEFIDGKTAVKLVQALQQQGFAPIANAIAERDKVITQLYQHVVQLSNTVKEMGGRFGQTDFDGKINNWLKEGGYPLEAADLAKEIYLAYEGDDLDNEFPQIFEARWNQIQTILDGQRKAKVDAARTLPKLPGRGGNGTASKPIGLKGTENAKQTADMLWDALQAGEQT